MNITKGLVCLLGAGALGSSCTNNSKTSMLDNPEKYSREIVEYSVPADTYEKMAIKVGKGNLEWTQALDSLRQSPEQTAKECVHDVLTTKKEFNRLKAYVESGKSNFLAIKDSIIQNKIKTTPKLIQELKEGMSSGFVKVDAAMLVKDSIKHLR